MTFITETRSYPCNFFQIHFKMLHRNLRKIRALWYIHLLHESISPSTSQEITLLSLEGIVQDSGQVLRSGVHRPRRAGLWQLAIALSLLLHSCVLAGVCYVILVRNTFHGKTGAYSIIPIETHKGATFPGTMPIPQMPETSHKKKKCTLHYKLPIITVLIKTTVYPEDTPRYLKMTRKISIRMCSDEPSSTANIEPSRSYERNYGDTEGELILLAGFVKTLEFNGFSTHENLWNCSVLTKSPRRTILLQWKWLSQLGVETTRDEAEHHVTDGRWTDGPT